MNNKTGLVNTILDIMKKETYMGKKDFCVKITDQFLVSQFSDKKIGIDLIDDLCKKMDLKFTENFSTSRITILPDFIPPERCPRCGSPDLQFGQYERNIWVCLDCDQKVSLCDDSNFPVIELTKEDQINAAVSRTQRKIERREFG